MDNDTLYLIDDNLDEIITYLNNGLKKSEKILETIDIYITFCCKTLGEYLWNTYIKNISDNTNKIKSQEFGGILTAKIA